MNAIVSNNYHKKKICGKTENTLTAYRVNPNKSKLSNLKLKFFYKKKPVKELENKTIP